LPGDFFWYLNLKNRSDSIYTRWLFLSLSEFIIGPRTGIALLTSFFAFSFGMLFLALVQNYAHAAIVTDHEIVPSFWMSHKAPGFDFTDDTSFQKYLNDNQPFVDTSYVPTDLVAIDSNFTANNSKAFKLREQASVEFADMAWHFRDAFSGDRLYISSAYRSFSFQDYLIKQWCKLIKCAQVGTSEHQAGLALDIKVIARWGRWYSLDFNGKPNKYYDWLKLNAARFWFHNTYQKGIEIDGKMAEWRHRRYLWTGLATILASNDQTFAEYYKQIQN